MADNRRGIAYGVSAYLLWGLFPLYWPLLEPASPAEILAHRIVWSLVFVVVVLAVTRQWAWIRPLLRDRTSLTRLTVAAVLIAGNWVLYIWGVNNEHVVETSLGYFINPIVTVMIGVLALHERLRPVQWAAIGLGGVAVVVLTVDYGRPPWIALGLAFSFASYGLLKKQVGARVGAVQSLAIETAVLFLPAAGFLVVLAAQGDGQLGPSGLGHGLLLASAGVVTAVPLLFFAAAASRVPAVDPRPAAVPHAGAAAADRRAAVQRADAGLQAGRLRSRLGRAAPPVGGRPAPRPADPARRRCAGAHRRLSRHIGASSNTSIANLSAAVGQERVLLGQRRGRVQRVGLDDRVAVEVARRPGCAVAGHCGPGSERVAELHHRRSDRLHPGGPGRHLLSPLLGREVLHRRRRTSVQVQELAHVDHPLTRCEVGCRPVRLRTVLHPDDEQVQLESTAARGD